MQNVGITCLLFLNFIRAKRKKPRHFRAGFLDLIGAWRCPTLTWGDPTLPSALLRFTTEFGMGSGGATVLWSPSKILLLAISC